MPAQGAAATSQQRYQQRRGKRGHHAAAQAVAHSVRGAVGHFRHQPGHAEGEAAEEGCLGEDGSHGVCQVAGDGWRVTRDRLEAYATVLTADGSPTWRLRTAHWPLTTGHRRLWLHPRRRHHVGSNHFRSTTSAFSALA